MYYYGSMHGGMGAFVFICHSWGMPQNGSHLFKSYGMTLFIGEGDPQGRPQ
jgi:hypothetical protein